MIHPLRWKRMCAPDIHFARIECVFPISLWFAREESIRMTADLQEKAHRYETLLAEAVSKADPVPPSDTPLGTAAADCLEMAESYLADGRHFLEDEDLVNALAAFSYGHAWLDAGARIGLFSVPRDGELFTI